jgi:hypothetical protein
VRCRENCDDCVCFARSVLRTRKESKSWVISDCVWFVQRSNDGDYDFGMLSSIAYARTGCFALPCDGCIRVNGCIDVTMDGNVTVTSYPPNDSSVTITETDNDNDNDITIDDITRCKQREVHIRITMQTIRGSHNTYDRRRHSVQPEDVVGAKTQHVEQSDAEANNRQRN